MTPTDSTQRSAEDESLADPLPPSPLPVLARWLAEAKAHPGINNGDAMAVATVDEAGDPQVRLVLCRRLDAERGLLSFYTNRESPKARELERTGRISAVFYWDPLGRQARITGAVRRTSDADSDDYFAGRHPLSRIAAWASAQSEPIATRAELLARFDAAAARFGGVAAADRVPRPPHWGGYVITAERIELWVGREGRLHDRAVYTREVAVPAGPSASALAPGDWRVERLQP